MNDILMNILYTIIVGCGSAIVSFLCALLKKKINELSTKINNEKIRNCIDSASDAVMNSVLTVSQTYVDSLKKDGKFTEDAAIEAKNKAIEIANNLITVDGKKAVETAYGDFETWLSTTIESNIMMNKVIK